MEAQPTACTASGLILRRRLTWGVAGARGSRAGSAGTSARPACAGGQAGRRRCRPRAHAASSRAVPWLERTLNRQWSAAAVCPHLRDQHRHAQVLERAGVRVAALQGEHRGAHRGGGGRHDIQLHAGGRTQLRAALAPSPAVGLELFGLHSACFRTCLTHRSVMPSSRPKRSAQNRLELPSNMDTMSSLDSSCNGEERGRVRRAGGRAGASRSGGCRRRLPTAAVARAGTAAPPSVLLCSPPCRHAPAAPTPSWTTRPSRRASWCRPRARQTASSSRPRQSGPAPPCRAVSGERARASRDASGQASDQCIPRIQLFSSLGSVPTKAACPVHRLQLQRPRQARSLTCTSSRPPPCARYSTSSRE